MQGESTLAAGALSRPRMPRWLVRVLVVGGTLAAIPAAYLGLALLLAWNHYRTTPDFATYVATHPVSDQHADGLWIEADVVGQDGSWSAGEVDPLAIGPDDPDFERVELRFQASIRHGDERLLELEQLAAFAFVRDTSERRGVALRTERFEVAPGFRLRSRLWVSPEETLIGPGSSGRGQLDFDVFLLAGEGADRFEIALRTEHGIGAVLPAPLEPIAPHFLAWIHPSDPAPEEGLVHRIRQSSYLTWQRGSSAMHSKSEFAVSTEQYSCAFETKLLERGYSTSYARKWNFTWGDRIW